MSKSTRTPDEVVGRMIDLAEKKYNCGTLIFEAYNQINAILSNRY